MTVQIVTLRTGTEVPAPAVGTVSIALARLIETNFIALYEAVEIARHPAHAPFGNTGDILKALGLLEDSGRMHDATRAVILASTDGEDMGLCLVSPYAQEVQA